MVIRTGEGDRYETGVHPRPRNSGHYEFMWKGVQEVAVKWVNCFLSGFKWN